MAYTLKCPSLIYSMRSKAKGSTLGQGFLTRAAAAHGTYSSLAMRLGYLSQTASASQLHAVEAMRTQTTT